MEPKPPSPTVVRAMTTPVRNFQSAMKAAGGGEQGQGGGAVRPAQRRQTTLSTAGERALPSPATLPLGPGRLPAALGTCPTPHQRPAAAAPRPRRR